MLQAAMVRVAPLKLQSRCLGATAKAGAHQFEPVQKYDPLCVYIYIHTYRVCNMYKYTYIYILCSIYIHIVGRQPTKKKLGHHIGEALQNIKLSFVVALSIKAWRLKVQSDFCKHWSSWIVLDGIFFIGNHHFFFRQVIELSGSVSIAMLNCQWLHGKKQ